MAGLVVLAVLWALPIFVAHKIGKSKGRRGWPWGFWLGWTGVIIVACLGPKRGAKRGFSAATSGRGGSQMWPPAMPTALPAGWYADPAGGALRRYWDDRQWTEDLAPSLPASQ
jgi:hypothetical protein